MVKNPPSKAGDTGSIGGRETRISHAERPIGPYSAAAEPGALEPTSHN